jgi:hypothetical protein
MVARLDLAPDEVTADPLGGIIAVLALPFFGFSGGNTYWPFCRPAK